MNRKLLDGNLTKKNCLLKKQQKRKLKKKERKGEKKAQSYPQIYRQYKLGSVAYFKKGGWAVWEVVKAE